MKLQKALAAALSASMLAAMLAGCGSGSGTAATTAAAAAQAQTAAAQTQAAPAGGAETETKAEAGGPLSIDKLTVAVTSWPANLDPATKMGKTCTRWITQVYDTLLYCNNDGTLTSYIADDWKMIDDLTAEVKLKPGITFHNGYPLTAEDVKFSYDRVLFDTTGYVDPNAASVLNTISEIEVVDDLTVRFKTAEVDPILFDRMGAMLGIYIVSKKYMDEVGQEKFGTAPVGTGPYKVDSISPEKMELSFYEGYYGTPPVAKKLDYRYITEETALVTGLVTGEIDICPDLAISSAKMLAAQNTNVNVVNLPSATSHLLRFHAKDGVTGDKKLRQALSLAIDRQLLADTLWEGYASVPNGYNYEEFGKYYVPDYPAYEYNVDKAKQLVSESSYNGETINFEVVQGYYPLGSEVAEAIVDMWKDIGVNAQVKFVDKYKTSTIEHLANWSNGLRFSDPLGGMWSMWGEGTGIQKDMWDAPERFNELGHMMLAETDVDKRREEYREMMQIWDDDVPGTILYCPDVIYALRKDLTWDYVVGRALNLRADYLKLN